MILHHPTLMVMASIACMPVSLLNGVSDESDTCMTHTSIILHMIHDDEDKGDFRNHIVVLLRGAKLSLAPLLYVLEILWKCNTRTLDNTDILATKVVVSKTFF